MPLKKAYFLSVYQKELQCTYSDLSFHNDFQSIVKMLESKKDLNIIGLSVSVYKCTLNNSGSSMAFLSLQTYIFLIIIFRSLAMQICFNFIVTRLVRI